jgi:hypothetical protein
MTDFTITGRFTSSTLTAEANYAAAVKELLSWSSWQPLKECWRGSSIPALPGLYRIRRIGIEESLDYISQTSSGKMTLRRRLGMLRGVYSDEMPYRDPHTAAPALWALRHREGCDYEVSITPIMGSTQWRKGLEALAISLYRQEKGASPAANFGRMPAGYRMSSGNNRKLASSGKRFRGGQTSDAAACHAAGVKPAGPLEKDVQDQNWCGYPWSVWVPVAEVVRSLPSRASGLYRLRGRNQASLLYIGEGIVRCRLAAHTARAKLPADTQGKIFSGVSNRECSWVFNDSWPPHQRLELENDLIAAHILSTGAVPAAQFLG